MINTWQHKTWGEVVELKYGKAIRGYKDLDSGFRVFGSNGPIGYAEEPLFKGPGVILGRKGAYRGVEYSASDFSVIDTAYSVEPIVEMNMRWLYYAIQYYGLGEIDDGSPIPSTTRAAVYVRELYLPSIEEQKLIAKVLGEIDDKIVLSQLMNETLEVTAQAIFKDWFVDFGPVKRKLSGETDAVKILGGLITDPDRAASIATLFPDSLRDDGLPSGFGIEPLGNKLTIKRGGSPRPIKDFMSPSGWPWVKIADATAIQEPFLYKTKGFIKPEGLKKTVKLQPGDLILSNSATPGLPKFLMIEACIHDGWLHFPEIHHFTKQYLYLLFKEIRRELVIRGNGSVFTNLKTDILRNYDVVIPPVELIQNFDRIMSGLFSKLQANTEESQTLAETRDYLLPRLMSGEVRVGDSL